MPTGYIVPEPPVVAANATVVEHTGDATLTTADAGKIHTNTGAIGTVVLTLPTVASMAGQSLKIWLTVDQIVRLLPQTGQAIYLGGSGVVTKYLNIAAVISNYVDVHCDGEQWLVLDYSGVVTKQA